MHQYLKMMMMIIQMLLFLLCLHSCHGFSTWNRRGRHSCFQHRWTFPSKMVRKKVVLFFDMNDNQNKDADDNDNNVSDRVYDADFTNWITSSVKSWPRSIPTASSTTTTTTASSDTTRNDETSNSLPTPLSRLLNIETLLQLASTSKSLKNATSTTDSTDLIDTDEKEEKVSTSSWNDSQMTSTVLEELSAWDVWVNGLRKSDGWGKTTAKIEALLTEASSILPSAASVRDLIRQASGSYEIMEKAAKQIAMARGLDVVSAAQFAKETTQFAQNLVQVADDLFRNGYLQGDRFIQSPTAVDDMTGEGMKRRKKAVDTAAATTSTSSSRALFDGFSSAYELNKFSAARVQAASMGALAGAIYEDTLNRCVGLGHALVARGYSDDVAWMVTDSLAQPASFWQKGDGKNKNKNHDREQDDAWLVRTITIRGFDASDENIDREHLLNRVCTAIPKPIQRGTGIRVHSGMLEIAQNIFADVRKYVEWSAPNHKIVLNGHSIGGSLSVLILLLMVKEYGIEFVTDKVLRVYTFGSPPVAEKKGGGLISKGTAASGISNTYTCDILDAFGLPASIVHGYVQPWDPIVRLFSKYDALYPLVGDLGDDGNTPWADGPPRAMRPIARAILEQWDNWPKFRSSFKGTANQTYSSVGIQHIMLPYPTRYLADRFVAVTIPVPPVATILRISSRELYPALFTAFPLDEFQISFIPQTIRSFVHHFYPAYGFPLVDYVKELQRRSKGLPERTDEYAFGDEIVEEFVVAPNGDNEESMSSRSASTDPTSIDYWSKATAWLTRGGNN